MFTFSLTVVRHGETSYNKEKLLQGQGVDTSLSETGVQQGEAVGRYLRNIPFTNVFVSNLQRAVQTAELILKNNTHCSGMEMVLEPLLREKGFGVCEGRPKEDLKNMANASGQSCRDFTPPGGETQEQVRLRFKKFLKVLYKQMLDEHGWSAPNAPAGESAAADGTSAAASDPAPGGSADDGLQGASAHALVVSHGAYIRVAHRHLVEDLNSSLPAGVKMSHLFSPLSKHGDQPLHLHSEQTRVWLPRPVGSALRLTNRKTHLDDLTAAE